MTRRIAFRPGALAALVAGVALLVPLDSAGAPGPGSRGAWTLIPGEPPGAHAGHPQVIEAAGMRTFALDRAAIGAALRSDQAPVSLPAPDGRYVRFEVAPTPVMAPKLARLHPEIRTYAGTAVDDPRSTVRITTSPLGLQASVRGGRLGAWYIDPVYRRDTSLYGSYLASALVNRHGPLVEHEEIDGPESDAPEPAAASIGGQLRTYRLALLTDPAYADYFGAANVTAAKVALMTRVDQIYEDELAISMVLIGNNDLLNFNTPAMMTAPGGPCGAAACYTTAQASTCGGGTLSRTRIVIGQLIGASNYDIGHIGLGRPGGGVASLGVVGRSAKAQGCTGLPEPVGDFYAVDYVAHEMGHQYSGNHTFNGTDGSCFGPNRNPETSVEAGSGSSIMAYAGICDRDDLQPHSDPYFSQRSFDEIVAYVGSSQSAINEVQSAAISGFDGTDSFTLTYDGNTSGTITNGTNYNTVGLTDALASILPPGTVPLVNGFGGAAQPNAQGFQVDFDGALAGTNVPHMLQLTNVSGLTGSVNEIDKGGPVDNGGATSPTGNTPPVVTTAGSSFTIPYRSPFALTGSATDADADPLTYMWEQNDAETGPGTLLVDPNKTTGPLFRQFGTALDATLYDPTVYESPGENHPTSDPTRVFPDMPQILANNTNAATGDCPNGPPPGVPPVPPPLIDCYSEFLPVSGYPGPMHFRLTARDGRTGGGGVASAETTVNLAPGTGPFLVTEPNTGVAWSNATPQAVTWNVAGTSGAPIGAANVRISLSTDGGQTFPHELAASTANDGSEQVSLPAVNTTQARIKVEAVGNVFFDLSDADFTINAEPPPPAPTVRSTVPPSPANDNSPEVIGTAQAGTTVRLYDNAACTGTPLGSGAASTFSAIGLVAGVADDTTTNIYATATGGSNNVSPCSSSFVTYVEDSTAPKATITQAPKARTKRRRTTFKFEASEPGSTFQCSIDGEVVARLAASSCSSPTTFRVPRGRHTFSVQAVDAAGNADPSPAEANWKVRKKRRR